GAARPGTAACTDAALRLVALLRKPGEEFGENLLCAVEPGQWCRLAQPQRLQLTGTPPSCFPAELSGEPVLRRERRNRRGIAPGSRLDGRHRTIPCTAGPPSAHRPGEHTVRTRGTADRGAVGVVGRRLTGGQERRPHLHPARPQREGGSHTP